MFTNTQVSSDSKWLSTLDIVLNKTFWLKLEYFGHNRWDMTKWNIQNVNENGGSIIQGDWILCQIWGSERGGSHYTRDALYTRSYGRSFWMGIISPEVCVRPARCGNASRIGAALHLCRRLAARVRSCAVRNRECVYVETGESVSFPRSFSIAQAIVLLVLWNSLRQSEFFSTWCQPKLYPRSSRHPSSGGGGQETKMGTGPGSKFYPQIALFLSHMLKTAFCELFSTFLVCSRGFL